MKTADLVKALPLCCLFLAAANNNDCTIHIVQDNGGCEDISSVCNLTCDLKDNSDGCPICECADSGEGEGEGQGGACTVDSDCGPGQLCAVESVCPACTDNDPACAAPCTLSGVCVDVQPDPCAAVDCAPGFTCIADPNGQAQCIPTGEGCVADTDCGQGFFCDFSQCGGTPNGGSDRPIACNSGVCVEVPPPPPVCQADADCGPGGVCLNGQCQFTDPCNCGPTDICVFNADGTTACIPTQQANCTSDVDCAGGQTCNAADVCLPDPACTNGGSGGGVPCDPTMDPNCSNQPAPPPPPPACTDVCWGFCQDPQPALCSSDTDCAAGQTCTFDPNTCAPGSGGLVACAGICR